MLPVQSPYPPPPWQTRGRASIKPYLVRSAGLQVPPGFDPIVLAGYTIGLLGLIEYVPPSPLTYSELVWMPCPVRVGTGARRRYGYFVERMYVDSDASLAAGRAIWGLPKRKARFEVQSATATIDTEDGERLALEVGPRGPRIPTPIAFATLQDGGSEVVALFAQGTARVSSAHFEVREASGLEVWMGWNDARPIRGAGVVLCDFAIAMKEPRRLTWSQ